jgi:hypothetical protein
MGILLDKKIAKAKKIDVGNIEDFAAFDKWWKKYQQSPLCDADYIPEGGVESWFSEVQSSHKAIRELIGGIYYDENIQCETYQKSATTKRAQSLIKQICGLVNIDNGGDYEIYDNVTDDYIQSDDLLFPSMPNGMRTGKWLAAKAKALKLDAYRIETLNDLTGKLGQEWALSKTKKQEVNCRLTTAASAFLKLGDYGPDRDSCYAGCQSYCWTLAMADNSFVLLLRDKSLEDKEENEHQKNLARMWGFYNEDDETLNLCNYYNGDDVNRGNTFDICKTLAENILGCKVECHENQIHIAASIAYHNIHGTVNWTFANAKKKKINDQYI